jgi:galactokinase
VNPLEAKAELVAKVDHHLPDGPRRVYWVPGRIELLGKHTDYAGGHSLVFPIDRGFIVGVGPAKSEVLRIIDASTGEAVELPLSADPPKRRGHWSLYAATVVGRLVGSMQRDWVGGEVAFASDLPRASGMSSSSALVIAMVQAMIDLNDLEADPIWQARCGNGLRLAEYAGAIEGGRAFDDDDKGRGVGTFGGSEDHAAILCGRAGSVSRFGYCPLRRIEDITWPSHHALLVGCSGVAAEKTGDAMERYNRASTQVARLATLWADATGESKPLAQVLEGDPQAAPKLRELVRQRCDADEARALGRRLDHLCVEHLTCVPEAAEALRAGDLSRFGQAVARSQQATDELLDNLVEPTRFLAAEAVRQGAMAASAFGAGFGGSVWAMAPNDAADDLLNRWQSAYEHRFPEHRAAVTFFGTYPSIPAQRLA